MVKQATQPPSGGKPPAPPAPPDVHLSTYVLNFGQKHRGERIQRVPVSYLLWMVNAQAGPYRVAQMELDRRGTVVPEIEVSGHAIDAASLRIRKTWHENRAKAEGLHSWLCRAALDARRQGESLGEDAYSWLDIKWVIADGDQWPTLRTVIPLKRKGAADE